MINEFNIKKILLDMDGPLVDDIAMFKKVEPSITNIEEHIKTLTILGKKQAFIIPIIFEAIKQKAFEDAEPTMFLIPLKNDLLKYWKLLGIEVEVLSSTMQTNPLRKELEEQKLKWCETHLPGIKVNLAEGSAKKQDWAEEGTLLIDDFARTISQFINKGAYGIHHTSLNDTLYQLRLLGLIPQYN